MPAHNERFGATAAGSADLKGSAGKLPLREAAIPLSASGGSAIGKESENRKIISNILNINFLSAFGGGR